MIKKPISDKLYQALHGIPPTTRYSYHLPALTTIRPNQLVQTAMYYDALLSNTNVLINPGFINTCYDYCLTRIATSVRRELNVGTLIKTKQGIQLSNKHNFLSTLARQIKRAAYAILDIFLKIFKQPTPPPLDKVLSSVFSNQYQDRPYYERQAKKLRLLLNRKCVFTCCIPDSLQSRKDQQSWSTKYLSYLQYPKQDAASDGNEQKLSSCQSSITHFLHNFIHPQRVDQLVSGLSFFSHMVDNYIIKKMTEEQQLIIDSAIKTVHIKPPTPVTDELTPIAHARR